MRKNSSKKHGVNSILNRSQSAMEYLMTYGWAILIIAIVLVALFSLGIFNSSNFSPRAQPGSCEVLRNSAQTSLVGQCNGMLPQYVANFSGSAAPGILINTQSDDWPTGTNALSLFAWVKSSLTTNWVRIISYGSLTQPCGGNTFAIDLNYAGIPGSISYDICGSSNSGTANVKADDGAWNLVGITIPQGGGPVTFYFDGQVVPTTESGSGSISISNNPMLTIGVATGTPPPYAFVGQVANVQLYNTSLSQPEIQALYKEGIGGAPINVNNLVGWWPLNGNANDYSGNDNNGVSANVTYTSAWASGYSTP